MASQLRQVMVRIDRASDNLSNIAAGTPKEEGGVGGDATATSEIRKVSELWRSSFRRTSDRSYYGDHREYDDDERRSNEEEEEGEQRGRRRQQEQRRRRQSRSYPSSSLSAHHPRDLE